MYFCFREVISPIDTSFPTDSVVKIEQGMGVFEIGQTLKTNGVIKSPLVFCAITLLSGSAGALKAGNYSISSSMNMIQILKLIASGETLPRRFTVPEGLTCSEIAKLWEEKGFGKAEGFLQELNNPDLLKKYRIPANSLEGYLFPDTYFLSYDTSEREIIEIMLTQFQQKISHLIDESDVNLSIHQIVTLASIIEKEAKVDSERPIVSAVFHNRLRRNQKLESCATVMYSLGYPNRKLTYEDLKVDSLYNTYIHEGLPPGPICNPGLKSILAAINPSKVNYLYFVSKNDGTHYFTESYIDFLQAKKKYQGT